jgi:hypothetical protein
LAISIKRPKFVPKILKKRIFKSINESAFKQDASEAHWEWVYSLDDINDKVCVFENIIDQLLDKHAPVKVFCVTRPFAYWWDDEIKVLMEQRDEQKRKYLKSKKTDLFALDKFKQLKNTVTQTICNLKKAGFDKFINQNTNNKQRFWEELRQTGVMSNKKESDYTCNFSPQDLNAYFTSINNTHNIGDAKLREVLNSITLKTTATFELNSITELDILKVIKTIKTNASGSDNFNINIIKLTLPYSLTCLCHIINTSFITGIFPSKWKKAIVIPVPKNNNPTQLSHYRPVSLLSVLSKIIEKLVSIQVSRYVAECHLLDPFQSGFRSSHGTCTALIKITNDIYNAINSSKLTLLTLLDYSKAFDTINHTLLIAKLSSIGFCNLAIKWFQSYLCDRCQKVKINNQESDWQPIINGVPQGSVLGPLLFIIMTSDIHEIIVNSSYHLYADDTQLYVHGTVNELQNIVSQLNVDLYNVYDYSISNALKLNPDKTVSMIIGSFHNINKVKGNANFTLEINDKPIQVYDHARNLGITFDEVLSWRKHVDIMTSKAFSRLKLLYRHKNFLSAKSKIILCESLVLSIFNYCDVVYYSINEQLKQKIQRIQNYCIRFIFSLSKRSHLSNYLKKLNWLTMRNRQNLHVGVMMYKIIGGEAPDYLRDLFTYRSEIHTYSTRQVTGNMVEPRCTRCSFKSFPYYASLLYNNIPSEIKFASSITTFKHKYQNYLLLSLYISCAHTYLYNENMVKLKNRCS